MKKLLLLVVAVVLSVGYSQAQKSPFSAKLKKKEVAKVCNAVADWQIKNFAYDKRSDLHILGWANGVFYIGVSEWAGVGSQPHYYKFLEDIGETNKWSLLNLPRRFAFADDLCVGQMYTDIYRLRGEHRVIDTLRERLLAIARDPSTAPVSKRDPKGAYERWSWCDALFMAPPAFAAMYDITGDKVLLDYMNSEFQACVDTLFNFDYNLFYRDDRKKELREPNGERQFWARGCGWALAGIANTLDELPQDEPSRNIYTYIFKRLAAGLLSTQQSDGSWRASLLDPDSFPEPENSASALICYGLAWGVRNGYLDAETYRGPVIKAWQSLVKHVNKEGMLGYVQPIGEAPKNVTAKSTEVYGAGVFLLAGSEIYKMSR